MKVAEAYENLERIITYGFLSARVSFQGHDLLIKNISDKEYQQMLMFCSDKNSVKLNLFNLAYCTISIDGVNLLEDRNENIREIMRFYQRSSALFIIKIVDAINELNYTYLDSLDFLEGFSYSPRSRHLWTIVDPYDRSSYTGIRGLDVLGINSVVENWISINKRLDEEQAYGRDLNNTVLIVGASNYKSAKMLSKNYEAHTQELNELREEICKYGYDRKRVAENEKKRDAWTAPLDSREDLVKELYRQMTGDKDKHDLYIDKWIANQKEKAERAQESVREKQEAFRKKMESTDIDLLEPSKPISSQELNRLLEQKKNSENKVYTGSAEEEIKDRVLKKISTKIIRPEIKDLVNG
jgi:hypothetical protein